MMNKWKIGAVIGAITGAFYTVSCPFFYILFTVAGKQSIFNTVLAPILCEALSAPSVFRFIVETLSGTFGVSPIAVHNFFFSSNASFKLLMMLILVTWSGIGALIGAGTDYFDWQFPAIIGIGCFGGGFLGSMLRRLYKTGEEREATTIVLIVISFLIITHIPSLLLF